MPLDKKVKEGIKRGLINGALTSPFIVVTGKPLVDLNRDLLSYSDVIVKGENAFVNVYNILSESVQRLYEMPFNASLALISLPLLFAASAGFGEYMGVRSEEARKLLSEKKGLQTEKERLLSYHNRS